MIVAKIITHDRHHRVAGAAGAGRGDKRRQQEKSKGGRQFHIEYPVPRGLYLQSAALGHICLRQPHGIRNLKKLAAGEELIGIEFEKEPVPSNAPVLFVVQLIGAVKLVVTRQV